MPKPTITREYRVLEIPVGSWTVRGEIEKGGGSARVTIIGNDKKAIGAISNVADLDAMLDALATIRTESARQK